MAGSAGGAPTVDPLVREGDRPSATPVAFSGFAELSALAFILPLAWGREPAGRRYLSLGCFRPEIWKQLYSKESNFPSARLTVAVSGMCVVPDLLFQPGLSVQQLLTEENSIQELVRVSSMPVRCSATVS